MSRQQQFRWIPPGAVKVASKKSPAVVYLYGKSPVSFVVGYYGDAGKASFGPYRYKTQESRAAGAARWLKECDERAAYKAKCAAEKKTKLAAPHALKAGDVLVCSWGYDQTNVDYYEVLALVGARSVRIVKIGCESVETLSMQGESVPLKGKHIGDPMLKKVNEYGSVRIASYAVASKLEPKVVAGVEVGYQASHWTAYA